MGLFSLEKKRLRGIISMCVNIWRERKKKRKPDSSQQCPVRGNRHKLTHTKLYLNTRKTQETFFFFFFTLRIIKQWTRLHRELVESPSLVLLKTWLDAALSNLFELSLLKQPEWTRWSTEVLFNLNHSVNCKTVIQVMFKILFLIVRVTRK